VNYEDTSHAFFRAGWEGTVVDAEPGLETTFFAAFPESKGRIRIVSSLLTIYNVVELFQPEDLTSDYFQVDIDTWDCVLVERVFKNLPTFRPAVLLMEINRDIIPGVKFSLSYSQNAYVKFHGLASMAGVTPVYVGYGCSMSKVGEVVAKYGYRLIQLDWWDALYAHERVAKAFEEIHSDVDTVWRMGYAERHSIDPTFRNGALGTDKYYFAETEEYHRLYRNNCYEAVGQYWKYLIERTPIHILKDFPFELAC